MYKVIVKSAISGLPKHKHSIVLIICGILAPLMLITSVIIGTAMADSYNYIAEAICQLASKNSSHPQFTIIGFVAYGLLMIGLAFELNRSLRPHKYARLVGLLLVLHGIGFIFTGFLRADPTTTQVARTPMGILHNVSASVGCLALVLAVFAFARITYFKAGGRLFARLTLLILVLVLTLLMVSLLPAASHVGGLLQRIYSTLPLVWVELVSIKYVIQLNSPTTRSMNGNNYT